ncbi:MAG TPA: flagellar basal-body rod protein FlgF [Paracoccaceae bacterium]|nr:flagellar basal-body rod protein FlgF [Paracoccaceae bacterium]
MPIVQYVGLSAQIALERRLDGIARNVANQATAGYRAEGTKFDVVLSRAAGADPVAYASAGRGYISREAGAVTRTENPLDIAVEGDAWLAIQTQAGTVYTRDGRMKMLETGELMSLNGHPVLDVGGAPILLDPLGGPPQIARDGMITQGGAQIGAIGLFAIDERARLTRYESGVIPDWAADPVLDFTATGVVQGFVEGSNVNPVLELTKLIAVSRSFDSLSTALGRSESSLREAIKALGPA